MENNKPKKQARYTMQVMSQDRVEVVLENIGIGRVLLEIAIYPKNAHTGELVFLITKIEEND